MNRYFEGWYYKQQKDNFTLALIPGRSRNEAFIQVITDEQSYHIPFPLNAFQSGEIVHVGKNKFCQRGIQLSIHTNALQLRGQLSYENITPLSSDIMGPFRFLPMECRHAVISMNHRVNGTLSLNGKTLHFTGGKGYIEGDRGRSFPESYSWTQCNAFDEDCSIMVSAAKIPFAGFTFWGCIASIWYQKKEYRLATYKGAKISHRSKHCLEIKQSDYILRVDIPKQIGHLLYAPSNGDMSRTIHENPSCTARYQFKKGQQIILDKISKQASYEHVDA